MLHYLNYYIWVLIDSASTYHASQSDLGSFERFIGILREHYEGNLPAWLAPVQIAVLPITDEAIDYATHFGECLKTAGLNVEMNFDNETISSKIRLSSVKKFLI